MARKVRGQSDDYLEAVMKSLEKYELKHPLAAIEGFRQNSVSIRIRVIDPDFTNISRVDRHNTVWEVLDELPEDVQSHISTVLLLSPSETKKSFANIEFDEPIPSKL